MGHYNSSIVPCLVIQPGSALLCTLWDLRASAPIPSKTGGDLCYMHDFSALAAKFLSPHNECILEGEMSGDQPHMTLHRLLNAWLSDAEGLL